MRPEPSRLLLAAAVFALLGSLILGSVGVAHASEGDAASEGGKASEGDEPAALDTVIHKNGSVWEGRILQETEDRVIMERVSKTGGVGRITFPRADIKLIRRGRPESAGTSEGGPRLLREEWFLLRSSARIIGTRRLELWAVTSRGEPGFRLEEAVEYFPQGPQLPATRTHRTEEVDQRFLPTLLAYREEGDASTAEGGPERYARNVSGRVVNGEWRGSSYRGGMTNRCVVQLPKGTRGPLGTREHLLRMPRRVGLLDLRVIDPDREEIVHVRAGFTSVTKDPSGRRPGHEFHWESDGRRFISYFDREQNTIQEQISEGVMAMPVSREQAEAAAQQAGAVSRRTGSSEITLAEAGIAFTAPGPLWTWQPKDASPGNTGWRVLGRLANAVLVTDVRVEWHPLEAGSETAPDAVQTWLERRLRSVSGDIKALDERRELTGVEGAWQLDLQGTLRKESVRTVAVVVDRPGGRVVLLLAGPAGAWEQIQPAVARFVRSLRLL